jgi:hypothetical protein
MDKLIQAFGISLLFLSGLGGCKHVLGKKRAQLFIRTTTILHESTGAKRREQRLDFTP